jgi:hypothetical protein
MHKLGLFLYIHSKLIHPNEHPTVRLLFPIFSFIVIDVFFHFL